MHAVCMQLFWKYYDGHSKIRRVYVTLTNLSDDTTTQLAFFTKRNKRKELDYTMDFIRERFGATAILRAASYTQAGIILERSKKIGGHWASSET